MKGLKKIPGQKELSRVYKILQFFPERARIQDLALWSQWTRIDPRLGELLVAHLSQHWKNINPVSLNLQLKRSVWPSTFGVLLEHISLYHSRHSLSYKKKWNKKLFLHWSKCVMTDIPIAPDEQFFIGLYKAGGKQMKEECLYATKPYRRWGYFARDLMLNKARMLSNTLISPLQRKAAIDELLKSCKKFTVRDYLEKLDFQIHPRQAQRDLQNHKHAHPLGNTKNRYYTRK